jgi:hypothetical protein
MSGLTAAQSAYQATMIQQASTLMGSIQVQGTQPPAKVPAGASAAEALAIGLAAQDGATLAASIRGESTPPPSPLVAPGTNPAEQAAATATLQNIGSLLDSLA